MTTTYDDYEWRSGRLTVEIKNGLRTYRPGTEVQWKRVTSMLTAIRIQLPNGTIVVGSPSDVEEAYL